MRLAGAILALGVDFSSEHLGGSAGPLLYPVLAFGVCVVVGGMVIEIRGVTWSDEPFLLCWREPMWLVVVATSRNGHRCWHRS